MVSRIPKVWSEFVSCVACNFCNGRYLCPFADLADRSVLDEAQQEVRRLLDSTLASLDKFFASIRTGEISAARRSIAQ